MATPIVIGVGAIAAGLVGRQLFRSGFIGGKKAAEEWAKGGFRAKMDRKEAIAILGLKCVTHTIKFLSTNFQCPSNLQGWPKNAKSAERCTPAYHAL